MATTDPGGESELAKTTIVEEDEDAEMEEEGGEGENEGEEESSRVVHLPRGGVQVQTCIGPIQFGMPPETIKDSMALGLPIPTNFVVPPERFNRKLGPNEGINIAEFEFPAYANFFFRKKRVNLIVASAEVEERIRVVFQETLLGPMELDIEADFADGFPEENMPDLKKEMAYFRKFGDTMLSVDLLLQFTHFNAAGVAVIKGDDGDAEITIEHADGEYILREKGVRIAAVDEEIKLPIPDMPRRFDKSFRPPLFGVTVLGSSHGFDPAGRTSGYVVWVNRRGIMVDPPPQSTAILNQQCIPPSLIDACIITHCHADHDAGTFQKILREGRVTLMTTPTIMYSFLRKYAALSGLELEFLRGVFHYRAVAIGQPIKIRGGEFNFFYTLHSIPCIGFSVEFGGRSMVFSADHMNDPEKINMLFEQGVISRGRREQLLNFPWEHDIILHEAGVPPIHTPMSTLEALPDEIKKRLYVVHVAKNKIPEGSGLKVAEEGVQNTLSLHVERPRYSDAIEILDVIASIDLFSQLSLTHAREVLQIARRVKYPAGAVISHHKSWNEKFFVVAAGLVEARNAEGDLQEPPAHSFAAVDTRERADSAATVEDAEEKAGDRGFLQNGSGRVFRRYITGEYFGEEGVLEMPPRPVAYVARQKSTIIEFDKADFSWLLEGTKITDRIRHLVDMRKDNTMSIIEKNSVLKNLSPSQMTQLEEYMFRKSFKRGSFLWTKGEEATMAFIVASGTVKFDAPIARSRRPSEMAKVRQFQNDMKIGSTGVESSGANRKQRGARSSPHRRRKQAHSTNLGPGSFIADVDALLSNGGNSVGVLAAEDTTVLMIERQDLIIFFSNNPGVLLATVHTNYVV